MAILNGLEVYIPSILLVLGFISTSILGGLLVRSGMYKANQTVMEQTIASYEKQIVVRVELENTLQEQNTTLRKQIVALQEALEARDAALAAERERAKIWEQKSATWDNERSLLSLRIAALEQQSH